MKKILIFCSFFSFAFIACQKAINDTANLPAESSMLIANDLQSLALSNLNEKGIEAYPGEKGILRKAYIDDEEITYEIINGDFVFEGDIILDPEMLSSVPMDEITSQRTGLKGSKYRWKNKKVFYKIDPDLPNKERVRDAITHWEKRTTMRFIERDNQPDYIYFTKGSGCSSYFGRIGKRQKIVLGKDCTTGTAIHEIGHALGLFHEQARSDRNKFVKIHWANIEDAYKHNFKMWKSIGFSGFDKGNELDFNSIMLYHPFSFSKNGKPTITKVDGSLYEVNSTRLSKPDVNTIEFMYRNE